MVTMVTPTIATTKMPTLNLPRTAAPARTPPIAASASVGSLIRSASASTHQTKISAWNASNGGSSTKIRATSSVTRKAAHRGSSRRDSTSIVPISAT